MNSYNLSTLLKVRRLNKDDAERNLQAARHELELEEKKLALIQEQLAQKKLDRTQMQDNFFRKACTSPSNKGEVSCLALSAKKNICDESSLKALLSDQREQVNQAELRRNAASMRAMEAHLELKTISKHHKLWQQGQKRSEDQRLQNDADDQNGARFWLKKRA